MNGDRLKSIRESKNIGVNELGRRTGISPSYISALETGTKKNPSYEVLNKFADALGIPLTDLVDESHLVSLSNKTINNDDFPPWATKKDIRDFKKMLEGDKNDLMFDGIPLNSEDKQRILDMLTGLFWEAKRLNKHKPKKD